jgi:hypothetical protein
MSWQSANYRRRKPITVINVAGGATIDVNIAIPKDFDEFWDVIDSSANELRITLADGYTLATYDVDDGSGGAFNKTSRLGRIRIDGMSTGSTANEALPAWLYWDTETTAGDGSSAVTITSAETGYIELGSPSWASVLVSRPRLDTERPPMAFSKDSSEYYHLWLDLSALLEMRGERFASRPHYEELRRLTYRVLNNASSEQAGMADPTKVRFVEIPEPGGRGRRFFARLPVQSGTTANNYTLQAAISTIVPVSTNHRTFRTGASFKVRDLLEP